MQLEKNGKTILDLNITNKYVEIVFTDGTKLRIHESTFVHFYLYKGKKLENNELNEVIELENLVKGRDYAFTLLSKRTYSTKNVVDKLKKKNLNQKQIDQIIKDLKDSLLLNDEEYTKSLIRSFENKNYGKLRIINELRKDGIEENIISSLNFNDSNELKKAKLEIEHYIKINNNKNYRTLIKSSINHLLIYGYEQIIIDQIISFIEKKYNFEDEANKLKKDLIKAKKKYGDPSDYSIKTKIINYLVRKGYRLGDIYTYIGGIEDEIY